MYNKLLRKNEQCSIAVNHYAINIPLLILHILRLGGQLRLAWVYRHLLLAEMAVVAHILHPTWPQGVTNVHDYCSKVPGRLGWPCEA